jgi:CheY-like chemotaxis protein
MVKKTTVLIADDSETFTIYLSTILNRMRFKVVTAHNGNRALELARQMKPDLMLLDIDMPGMNGKEVLKTIKGDPETSTIPVIMLTIKGDDENIDECNKLKCDSFLCKPVEPQQFIETLKPFVDCTP